MLLTVMTFEDFWASPIADYKSCFIPPKLLSISRGRAHLSWRINQTLKEPSGILAEREQADSEAESKSMCKAWLKENWVGEGTHGVKYMFKLQARDVEPFLSSRIVH